jgi:hypothetical protein
VQPAGDLVAGPGQITMPLRPDLEHHGVTVGDHWTLSLGTQSRHRDGQGIVGVALASVLGVQQPHPGGQLGLHINHPLAGGDQLLGQQAAQPRGALYRPDPVRPGGRPRDQLLGLGRAGANAYLAQRLLGRGNCHRGVRALVRIDPDHHCHLAPSTSAIGSDRPWRACLIPDLHWAFVPLSNHATARSDRAGASI